MIVVEVTAPALVVVAILDQALESIAGREDSIAAIVFDEYAQSALLEIRVRPRQLLAWVAAVVEADDQLPGVRIWGDHRRPTLCGGQRVAQDGDEIAFRIERRGDVRH